MAGYRQYERYAAAMAHAKEAATNDAEIQTEGNATLGNIVASAEKLLYVLI